MRVNSRSSNKSIHHIDISTDVYKSIVKQHRSYKMRVNHSIHTIPTATHLHHTDSIGKINVSTDDVNRRDNAFGGNIDMKRLHNSTLYRKRKQPSSSLDFSSFADSRFIKRKRGGEERRREQGENGEERVAVEFPSPSEKYLDIEQRAHLGIIESFPKTKGELEMRYELIVPQHKLKKRVGDAYGSKYSIDVVYSRVSSMCETIRRIFTVSSPVFKRECEEYADSVLKEVSGFLNEMCQSLLIQGQGKLAIEVDYIWKTILSSIDGVIRSHKEFNYNSVKNEYNRLNKVIEDMKISIELERRDQSSLIDALKDKLSRTEEENKNITYLKNQIEHQFSSFMEKQWKAAQEFNEKGGFHMAEDSCKQMGMHIDRLERINRLQQKAIEDDLPKAMTIATRKNFYFVDAESQTDLSAGTNQFVQSYFNLNTQKLSNSILFAKHLSHPFEPFLARDLDYRYLKTKENWDDTFRDFILYEDSQNSNPCYTFMNFLMKREMTTSDSKTTSNHIPSLCQQITKMCLHYTRSEESNSKAILFCSIFGLKQFSPFSEADWANFRLFKKVVSHFLKSMSHRTVNEIKLTTSISKMEISEIGSHFPLIKRQLDYESIVNELNYEQCKSLVYGGDVGDVRKSEVPSDHLVQFLSIKLEEEDYSNIFKLFIETFEAADPEKYGILVKSVLEEVMDRVFKMPFSSFSKYYVDWFENFISFDQFFNYHTFLFSFCKSFFRLSADPLCRNPQIYLVDILVMKSKYLRRGNWMEKLSVVKYLESNFSSLDLECLSRLFYSKPAGDLSDGEREDILGIISAVRGKVELKSQNEKNLLLKNMSEEEEKTLIDNMSEYIIQSKNSMALDKIVERQGMGFYM